ncbi:MAG: hypothetical protein O3B13_04870 [Planctomycetota bacterium]|nr:hypothetical protein [Planctomycetota bacterium]
MIVNSVNRTIRRLTAAEGYLELELPAEALVELQKIQNPGPFGGPFMWLTGEALRKQGLFDEAIAPLRQAARALPLPTGRHAWDALRECLEKSGRSAAAEDMNQAMEYLEKRSGIDCQGKSRTDSRSTIRIDIPHFGKLQIDFDSKEGLTIKVNPEGDSQT